MNRRRPKKTAKRELMAEFGQNLRTERLESGLTQEDLAERLDISVAYVSLLERGGRNPPMTTVVGLAIELGVSSSYLMPAVRP